MASWQQWCVELPPEMEERLRKFMTASGPMRSKADALRIVIRRGLDAMEHAH